MCVVFFYCAPCFSELFYLSDVGGYFETGTLVRYDFLQEAASFALPEKKSLSGVGVPSEANLTQEELVFSFSTSSTPSILVYISSRTQDSMSVVLRHNGGLIIIGLPLIFFLLLKFKDICFMNC